MSAIGIYGGTFDPPHIGHLILADEARHALGLTRVLWVLTPDPPHKQGQPLTPLQHRRAMLELALAGQTAFEISTIEIDRPGPHYALDTVRLLADQNRGADLIYLMGEDSLRDLPTWHRPADLLAAVHALGVMRRPGAAADLSALEQVLPGIQSKVRYVDAPPIAIASSDIRRRAAEGLPYRYFLPEGVYLYILRNHLYQQA
jgi:nicotinate-nucleotide adenylyltransferase